MHFIHPVLTVWRAFLLVVIVGVLVVQAQDVVSPRFIPCGTGGVAVCDLQTGLMWETKTEAPAEGSGLCTAPLALHGVDLVCTVEDAQASWIPALNAEGGTGYAGYADWRMPDIQELATLFDYEAGSLDPVFGPVALDRYFSSTPNAGTSSGNNFWYVHFAGGGVDALNGAEHVRAVRGDALPAQAALRFIRCGEGERAVCDLHTGLMWERKIRGRGGLSGGAACPERDMHARGSHRTMDRCAQRRRRHRLCRVHRLAIARPSGAHHHRRLRSSQ